MARQLTRLVAFVALAASSLAACASDRTAGVEPGTYTWTLEHDGTTRPYLVHVPDPGSEPMALVVDLHGLASSPESQDALTGMSALGAEEGFVVVQPAALGGIPVWDSSPGDQATVDDVGFVRALVAAVAERVPVDERSVYVTGFSNGGGLAHRLACDAADLVAAIGTVAGAFFFSVPCSPSRSVSVIAFQGTEDATVPIDGIGGLLPPVHQWAEDWAGRDDCTGEVVEAVAGDVTTLSWGECAGDASVVLHLVDGGGHGWPGTRDGERAPRSTSSIDATRSIWDFFTRHPRR
ncbi:MAG TPA: PHB depolymerase family esterase [Acidimicrobiia bacterium]